MSSNFTKMVDLMARKKIGIYGNTEEYIGQTKYWWTINCVSSIKNIYERFE